MIDFRYHLVSLIAVFLAIALGIVIGTTALNGQILDDLESQVDALETDKRSLEDRSQTLQSRVDSTDQFQAAVAPALVEGALAGTTVTLTEAPVTLGRADDSTLVLTDDYASSRHARLVPGEEAWMLEDLGSTNGTYLGSAKVTRPTPVPLGQPIRIGKTVMELRK